MGGGLSLKENEELDEALGEIERLFF